MFLLDTNILSELMRSEPDDGVLEWMDAQRVDDLSISAITVAEIRLGVALLPEGKRKRLLAGAVEEMLQEFHDRVYPFGYVAAAIYSRIVAERMSAGMSISTEDAQIAAIAVARSAVLVTGNVRDFRQIDDLEILNPFA